MAIKTATVPPKKVDPVPTPVAPAPVVTVEPVFEVTTPAPDMTPIAEALRQLKITPPNVEVTVQEPPEKEDEGPRRVRIEIERDSRGFISALNCMEITDGE